MSEQENADSLRPPEHAVDTQPPSGGSKIEEIRELTGREQIPISAAQNEKDYEEFRIGHSLATSEIAAQELPSTEEIQQRAYEIYLRRGASHGHELDDWSRAEHELKEEYRTSGMRDAVKAARGGM